MASIIPKIKIGLAGRKREKHNLSFDCSTTGNIGTIQPTMCREMIPNSKFKVKVSSLVRLASMPTPTFGRMSLRHYHAFVKYADLWEPFDAMISGQHFGKSGAYQGNTFIPTKCPFFTMKSLAPFIMSYSDISICPATDIKKPYTITMTNVDYAGVTYPVGEGDGEYATMTAAIKAAQAADIARLQTAWNDIRRTANSAKKFGNVFTDTFFELGSGSPAQDDRGVIQAGAFLIAPSKSTSSFILNYADEPQQDGQNVSPHIDGPVLINYEGADLITKVNNYYVLMKFKAPLKRLRQIFIGLGYQFNPYDYNLEFNVLKLLAYYKIWFNLFRPNRELAFVDTNCYKVIKYLSQSDGSDAGLCNNFDDLIMDMMTDCYYYLPMDYFGMSVVKPQLSNQDNQFVMNTGVADNAYHYNGQYLADAYSEVKVQNGNRSVENLGLDPEVKTSNFANSPLTLRLAQRMLTWANKNTVMGRSIREYLKVHYGITDLNALDDGGIIRIGSSRTNIQISDVMSTAESSNGYLGEYAGKGIGYGDSETFDFTAKDFGVWITLSVIVPESGYYQGYLAENRHLNRYQFFMPEFDALGYQVLERGEVMDDFNCDSGTGDGAWNPSNTGGGFYRHCAFGFVPRYSEYKVGRNIVNGDLSLAGMANSMAPYTLDRRIPAGGFMATGVSENGTSLAIKAPDWIPSVVYDGFRRIDPTDHLGQYNRIFNYVSNDIDHFIIHNIFDVKCFAPMKSLSESFDTISNEDDGTIDVTHS